MIGKFGFFTLRGAIKIFYTRTRVGKVLSLYKLFLELLTFTCSLRRKERTVYPQPYVRKVFVPMKSYAEKEKRSSKRAKGR